MRNKNSFLSSLPLRTMSGREKFLALVFFLTNGNENTYVGIAEIKKAWSKTILRIMYNPSLCHKASSEGLVESRAQGQVSLTEFGRMYIDNIISGVVTPKRLISKNNLLPVDLREKMNINFEEEVRDLEYNYGHSGTCTAFLFRKILEKMIYLVFAKSEMLNKIEDKNKPGGLVGLEGMINACNAKIKGEAILMPKTSSELKGIKFLGDISAHNPLVNVKMETIGPQLPFIITAYTELMRLI